MVRTQVLTTYKVLTIYNNSRSIPKELKIRFCKNKLSKMYTNF